ncbi:MAG: thioredoxin [Candidatus Omnitrophota bacterium]
MSEITLNSANFNEQVLSNSNVILVDFWAEWCGPCRMMGPVLDELAKELKDKPISIAKCNVDESGELAEQYGIMSIPAFKIFKNGQVVDEWIGALSKDHILAKLEQHLV